MPGIIASPWKNRLTPPIPSMASNSSMGGAPSNSNSACGTALRMRVVISRSKPFMTLSTTVRIVTPSVSPMNDTQLMKVA